VTDPKILTVFFLGQQPEIEPPHITVRHHFQHFAWLKL